LIDIDDRVPQFLGRLFQSRCVEDAGVIDQDVQPAELARAGIDRGAPVCSAGDVQMNRDGGATARLRVDLLRGFPGLGVEHVANYDLSPFAHEQSRLGGPLSARTAGNKSHLAFEPIHERALSREELASSALRPR